MPKLLPQTSTQFYKAVILAILSGASYGTLGLFGVNLQHAGFNISTNAFDHIIPPVFVKPAVMNRMARLEPREERYHTEADDLYLIGSAEHTLGPIHMD